LIFPAAAVLAVGSGVETSLAAGRKGEGGEGAREVGRRLVDIVSARSTSDGGGGWGRPEATGTGA
jgi:hypothetical protein